MTHTLQTKFRVNGADDFEFETPVTAGGRIRLSIAVPASATPVQVLFAFPLLAITELVLRSDLQVRVQFKDTSGVMQGIPAAVYPELPWIWRDPSNPFWNLSDSFETDFGSFEIINDSAPLVAGTLDVFGLYTPQ